MSALGDFIRTQRKNLGLTQTALAIRIGMDDTYVSAVETGKRTPDGEQFLQMISKALELTDALARELTVAARKSQRIFRLPAEISTRKHEVLQALALDKSLSDEDMNALAAIHATWTRSRYVERLELPPISQGGPM
ncbi:helix-turn-helix domain-containing protein [Paraburkholderia bryophila]|uniref:Transcriptional regulator with XRE-family HTH domain n=1 Tax=Paraburkholderia bryophila TaxID=420952 RepID=A0A7Z0B1M1_9BURK|nr:helix-turn-helix transcriptional regulator [Paraburkholderia bryophila]NYH17839.1 transcriptional regulator with XRE-family HTH domain [Paraburkholderia bryophila]